MNAPLTHWVRITHHDTGAVELYCGETRDQRGEQPKGGPLCADCATAAFEQADKNAEHNLKVAAEHWQKVLVAERSRHIGWYDSATLRIESLERRLEKAERKSRKRGKR